MGFIRDRLAARHQSSCQPCDSQPQFAQSPCAPQPLIYNTPYATRGGCQPCSPYAQPEETCKMPSVTITDSREDKRYAPPAPISRGDKLPPLPRLRKSDSEPLPSLTTEDLYNYDGGKPARRGDNRPDANQADRLRQTERELRSARDEIDNLKKQIEQMRADVARMQQAPRPQAPTYSPPVVPRSSDGQPARTEIPKQPVRPEIPKQPVVAPPGQPGLQPIKPQDLGKPNDDFVARATAENKRLLEANKERKLEEVKAPFERFMQGERERLTRSMDSSSKEHPEAAGNNTAWLLSQPAESLIRDFGFANKMKDVTWYFRDKNVIADEDKVSTERKEQWEQVRNNASNPQDPNWEKKQGVLQEVMNGWHLTEGRRFGRMNAERGDSPVSNNKLQWQVDAAEALVKANSANVNHDFSTRAIIRGLVGNSNTRGEVNLPVPEAARIKLLDAITPMSKEAGNAFLGANPKDTALATVITALERSHASRRPEESFQTAAINKMMEFDDVRGIAVLQKLSTESANTKVKDLATAQLQKLRDKVK